MSEQPLQLTLTRTQQLIAMLKLLANALQSEKEARESAEAVRHSAIAALPLLTVFINQRAAELRKRAFDSVQPFCRNPQEARARVEQFTKIADLNRLPFELERTLKGGDSHEPVSRVVELLMEAVSAEKPAPAQPKYPQMESGGIIRFPFTAVGSVTADEPAHTVHAEAEI